MKDMIALRLYFPQSARLKPTRFWHHLSAPALSHHLLTVARKSGIHQALMHSVQAGYLAGMKYSHQHAEIPAPHHPLCIELIDTEERLRQFLVDHQGELLHVRAMLFHCELAI